MDPNDILAALQTLPPEAQAAIMAGLQNPTDMAQGAALANITWALVDVAVAIALYIPLCSWRPLSRLVFEYDEELDAQAACLKSGEMADPAERGQTTQALARVKAAKVLGFLVVMGAALVQ